MLDIASAVSQEVSQIQLSCIPNDSGTQIRVSVSDEAVRNYAEAYGLGVEMPPIVLFADESGIWIGDGHHRVAGARLAGVESISARVHNGGLRDAILHAVGANADHGVPRTHADRRHAVIIMLQDNEWSAWSDREISRQSQVNEHVVHAIRASMQKSQIPDNTAMAPAPKVRRVRRGASEYWMKTDRIGTRRAHSAPSASDDGQPEATPTLAQDQEPAPSNIPDDPVRAAAIAVFVQRAHDDLHGSTGIARRKQIERRQIDCGQASLLGIGYWKGGEAEELGDLLAGVVVPVRDAANGLRGFWIAADGVNTPVFVNDPIPLCWRPTDPDANVTSIQIYLDPLDALRARQRRGTNALIGIVTAENLQAILMPVTRSLHDGLALPDLQEAE